MIMLFQSSPHEAENQLQVSLREAFQLVQPKLQPPFPLEIPSPPQYVLLNQAILYAILTQSHSTKIHVTHLHAIVTDAYQMFVKMLTQIALEFYPKLVPQVKPQFLLATREMLRVSAPGTETLLFHLLRQIVGGDLSDANLWLCTELLRIVFDFWDWFFEEDPLLLTSFLFTYLRLLADHSKLVGLPNFEALKRMEIDFCTRVLRNHFDLCLRIGRDLVRLLQDLVHVPEFLAVWKDLLLNPAEFRVPGFSDISQLYCSKTSSRYHLLRITPEMENQLRFLLTHVRWGCQRRYQVWFATKFLRTPESETVISDIVRFICCAHHPPNDIIQSNVISRWAIIGWLIKSCRSNHVQANAKLALLYDWMFYNDKVDNIMNIEPGILLMVNYIPKYADMTQSLLEFLFQLVDKYDVQRKDFIVRGVSTAFSLLVTKGVIHSLAPLTSCNLLSPFLRERVAIIFQKPISEDFGEASKMSLARPSTSLLPTLSLTEQMPELPKQNTVASISALDSPVASPTPPVLPRKTPIDVLEDLVQSLRGAIKQSNKLGIIVLEEVLFLYAIHGSHIVDDTVAADSILQPQVLACQITEAFKSNGYTIFAPLKFPPKLSIDDEIHSASSLIICTFIFCQQTRMREMVMFWSKNGCPISPRFLSYASRLAYEAHKISYLTTPRDEKNTKEISYSETPLLKIHIDRYISYTTAQAKESSDAVHSVPEIDGKLISQLVEDAFGSYRTFLMSCNISHKEKDISLVKLLSSDIHCCCGWEIKDLKLLFYHILFYLPDLSTGMEECIRLLVQKLDHVDLVALQFEICLGRFSIFGKDIERLSHLVMSSLNWGYSEQQKFWGLIASELAVSKVRVEKIVTDFFYLSVIDPNAHSIAVGGLLALCARRAPSPEFVSMIFSLPDNAFEGFGASLLAIWVVSNASMLCDSLAKWLEQIDKDPNDILSNSAVQVNHSSISRFLDFLNKEETEFMGKLSVSIQAMKAKLADKASAQKSRQRPR